MGYPEFLNESGSFDENRLNEFIANLRDNPEQPTPMGDLLVNYSTWANIEDNVASGGREQVYFNMIRAGITGTLAEGEMEYKLENDKVDIRYVQIPFTAIPDSTITVDEGDIEKYIKQHEDDYKVDASRDIFFVEFSEEASVEDEDNIKAGLLDLLEDSVEFNEVSKLNDTIEGFLNTEDHSGFLATHSEIKLVDDFVFKNQISVAHADSIYNLEKGQTYGPYKEAGYFKIAKMIDTKTLADSVKVRHILIPFVGGVRADVSVTKTDEEAQATADSIYRIIRSGSAKFTDLLDLSSDKVSNEQNGEIEFEYGAAMAPEFKDFSFNNPVGSLGVVRTDFGYHIIEVLEQGEK